MGERFPSWTMLAARRCARRRRAQSNASVGADCASCRRYFQGRDPPGRPRVHRGFCVAFEHRSFKGDCERRADETRGSLEARRTDPRLPAARRRGALADDQGSASTHGEAGDRMPRESAAAPDARWLVAVRRPVATGTKAGPAASPADTLQRVPDHAASTDLVFERRSRLNGPRRRRAQSARVARRIALDPSRRYGENVMRATRHHRGQIRSDSRPRAGTWRGRAKAITSVVIDRAGAIIGDVVWTSTGIRRRRRCRVERRPPPDRRGYKCLGDAAAGSEAETRRSADLARSPGLPRCTEFVLFAAVSHRPSSAPRAPTVMEATAAAEIGNPARRASGDMM